MKLDLTDIQAQALADVLGHVGGIGPERLGIQEIYCKLMAEGFDSDVKSTRPYPAWSSDPNVAAGIWLNHKGDPAADDVVYNRRKADNE